jgi:hypothetical protein
VKRADAVGFDEDDNTIFLDMGDGVFSLHLQSMKANKILETGVLRAYMDDIYLIPYVSFFASAITHISPHLCIHMNFVHGFMPLKILPR